MNTLIKLNLGCGEDKREGWINVDRFGTPDVVHNLEQFPWPWEESSVEEIQMKHVLEHLGQQTDVFLSIMKELYRISAPNCRITIAVPHPRHDDFLNDPTHVRAITMESIELFSLKNNQKWIASGASNSPLALYNNVDFEIIDGSFNLDPIWNRRMADENLSGEQVMEFARAQNNVIKETILVLQVIK